MKRFLNGQDWRRRGLDFIVGALAVLGHAPFHFWTVTLISFAFLCFRLRGAETSDRPGRAGFGHAFWFALGYFFAGTHWIGSAFIARGPEFIPLMPPMILGLAALLAIFWGLAGFFFAKLKPQKWMSVIAFTALFFIAEYTRGHIFGGLPWNLPGYIFEGGGAMSQFASVLGIYGLSWLVLFVSGALSLLTETRERLVAGFLSIAVLIGLFGFGQNRLSDAEVSYVDGVMLRIVQVKFEQKDKFVPEKSVAIVNEFLRQTFKPGLSDVTHVIWPEGAANGLAVENYPLINLMANDLAQVDSTPPVWLFNSLRREQRQTRVDGPIVDDYYNTSVALEFSPGGTVESATYNDKRRLVPFGEFIPGGKWMEAMNVPIISTSLASISPASEKTQARFPGLPVVSPQLCYEIIFPGLTPRSAIADDTAWILNQSNDAWFGSSIGPRQHANIARYRAIEEGIPVVRAASNGISGIIDPYGNYIAKVEPENTGIVDSALPNPIEKPTYNMRINHLLLLINLLIALMCCPVARTFRGVR